MHVNQVTIYKDIELNIGNSQLGFIFIHVRFYIGQKDRVYFIPIQCCIKIPQHPALLSSWHSLQLSYCILSCLVWVSVFLWITQHPYLNWGSIRAGPGWLVLAVLRMVFSVLLQVLKWMDKWNESAEWINERLCFQLWNWAADWKASSFHQHKHNPRSLAEITTHFNLLLFVASYLLYVNTLLKLSILSLCIGCIFYLIEAEYSTWLFVLSRFWKSLTASYLLAIKITREWKHLWCFYLLQPRIFYHEWTPGHSFPGLKYTYCRSHSHRW